MAHHVLLPGASSVHWGYFDAALRPVIEIDSGDKVTLTSVSGPNETTLSSGHIIPPALREVLEKVPQKLPGHMLTGPIAVRGAMPGDVLEIRIEDIRLVQDWGYNVIAPLWGALPNDYAERRMVIMPLDMARKVARLPWGGELPLRPFFGVMGVAPPKGWGMISSIQPRKHGGNLDNKELIPGTTLYLPVHVEGALFSAGDGHGAQGDGEVCVTAIETALQGTFEIHLRRDMAIAMPRAETPTHWISMGIDPDLDDAAVQAVREMIAIIREHSSLTDEDAYRLCSLAADLRVTQIVNEHKGVHAMLAKSLLQG